MFIGGGAIWNEEGHMLDELAQHSGGTPQLGADKSDCVSEVGDSRI